MEDSRNHIIKTASNLFLQRGYYAVKMQDIVETTGLSKGAFYHYFKSKEQVFEEVVGLLFNSDHLDEYQKIAEGSLWDFSQKYIGLIAEKIRDYNMESGDEKGMLRANQYILIFDAMKLLPNFGDLQQQIHQKELSIWCDVIHRAKKRGEIETTLQDEQVAKLFIYQNYGIGVYHVLRSQIDVLTHELQGQFKAIYESLKA